MVLAEVLIERSANALNRPFTYLYTFSKPLKIGVRVLVSFARKEVVAYVVNVINDNRSVDEYEKDSGFKLYKIKSVIDEEPILNNEMLQLAKLVSSYYLSPFVSVLQAMLPPSLKPKYSALSKPKIHYEKYLVVNNENVSSLTKKQLEVFNIIKNNKETLKSTITSKSIIDKLLEKNLIKEVLKEESRFKVPEYLKEKQKILTSDQENAVKEILETDKKVSLIEGVTGSGKTEIYLKLCEAMIKQGKTAIILVPEISLTSIMMEYYVRRFKNDVAILHSELTAAEKYDEYRKIANGKAKIVIGARSAIFAPISNLGLIIIDEEHSESYKQDVLPAYHAKEIAFIRSKQIGCKIVLGSATPSLESKARAEKGIYKHILIKERINKQALPKTYIVNMLDANNLSHDSRIISNLLFNKIKERLDKKEQIILLVNRRGFSTSIMCRECGNIIKCDNCGVPLIYHDSDKSLKCHHCGHSLKLDKCPACGSKFLSRIGFGTEKIEKEINKLFPHAKTLRLDGDVAKKRTTTFRILDTFRNRQADILIGTQMIAKGHDFPNVTLVGIVLADIGLSLPSFRNREIVFTLITQAIGRSGRDKLIGEAVVQTYLPNSKVIKQAADQDYHAFYNEEMSIRKLTQYPPYTYLVSLTLKSKNEDLVNDYSSLIVHELNNLKITGVTILGPSTPYIPYDNKLFIKTILIKYKNEEKIRKYIENLLITLQNKPALSIQVNVDPYDF